MYTFIGRDKGINRREKYSWKTNEINLHTWWEKRTITSKDEKLGFGKKGKTFFPSKLGGRIRWVNLEVGKRETEA